MEQKDILAIEYCKQFSMSKIDSIYLKGWAVLFMMFLHFGNSFVAPEYQYSWSGNDWDGAFQICVPIFLFLSGYGLMVSYINKGATTLCLFRKEAKRAVKLFKHYWVVTIPFIAVALYIGKFSWSMESCVLTLTALRCDWCPTAWFVSLYIELILLFPFVACFLRKKRTRTIVVGFLIVIVATKIIGKISWIDNNGVSILARQVKMLMNNLPIFLEGILFAKYDLFSFLRRKLNCLIGKHHLFGGAISLLLVVGAIACRAKLPLVSITEIIHVPVCLLGLILLLNKTKGMFNAFVFVGKYSTTLWLIHTYFNWTFFQSLIYSIRFWPLAFLFFVLMSLAASVLIDTVKGYIRI